jgi:pimeloyl-ACP methyl ester carboxylesterase
MQLQTHRLPGLVLTDHIFEVPLDHDDPDGEQISVFAREVSTPSTEHSDLPWLVFLQGGPGGKSPRPFGAGGWIKRATQDYRVLLLDQRGTGRSSPINRQTLAARGDGLAQAEYLSFFRADSIVRDAERIREELAYGEPWSILGQSYGGFCSLTYLSIAPEGLRESFITGGLAPLTRSADEVYRATYRRVLEQNRRYFSRYPDDQDRAQAIAAYLNANEVRMPNGERLSVRRFQTLGMALGMSDGFESLHYLLDEAVVEGVKGPVLNDTFLFGAMQSLSFATNPLYAVLHESIYGQGSPTNWSAHRIREEYPAFNYQAGQPFLFTGEMIYPWMFEEDQFLRPMREASEYIAQIENWPALYDVELLQRNTVPVAAVVYADDMYVERQFSEETAQTVANCRIWLTNEYQHNGLRADGETILGRLISMVRGEC